MNELIKTLHRADICGCFSQDIPPRVPLPLPWVQSIAFPLIGDPNNIPNPVQRMWRDEFPNTYEWLSVYDLLYTFIHELKRPCSLWMEPVLHRLLSLRPSKSAVDFTRASIVEDVCRIGSLLFLAPMWRLSGLHPVRTMQMRNNLLDLLKTHRVDWGQCRVILLWTLAQAVREAEKGIEQREFAIMLLMVSRQMRLFSWQDIIARVESVLSKGEPISSWDVVEKALQDVRK